MSLSNRVARLERETEGGTGWCYVVSGGAPDGEDDGTELCALIGAEPRPHDLVIRVRRLSRTEPMSLSGKYPI